MTELSTLKRTLTEAREIADQRLRDPVHPNRKIGGGKRILRKPDKCAEKQRCYLASPHQSEVHSEQQRKFEPFCIRDEPRQIELADNRDQRKNDERDNLKAAEPVLPNGRRQDLMAVSRSLPG